MENASQALLIAAGILIGVLVLSLIVYLYVTFGAQAQSISEVINQRQLTKYNAQYTVYDGRSDLSVYDVVTIVNTAHENNEKHKDSNTYSQEYQIQVILQGKDLAKVENSNYETEITSLIEGNYETKYRCTVNFYADNGKVSRVNISVVK